MDGDRAVLDQGSAAPLLRFGYRRPARSAGQRHRRKGQCVHLFAFPGWLWRGSLRRPRRLTVGASPGSSRTPGRSKIARGSLSSPPSMPQDGGRRVVRHSIPAGYTAAHRTLPFGSQVTVTNPQNGRSATGASMTAARSHAGLHSIWLVVPLTRLACTERSGCACTESGIYRPQRLARSPHLSGFTAP